MQASIRRYRWFVSADINGMFGVVFDNLTVLSFLAGILIFAFGFPAEFVYSRMFPGTAIGVLLGNLAYAYMALRLSRRSGRDDVTAMPLGLDTPSTIGMALVVLGPVFKLLRDQGLQPAAAAERTWHIGMATMVLMGITKLLLAFAGDKIRQIVPRSGLLGSLAGIGIALIGMIPLIDIFGLPAVGIITLGLTLYSVVGRLPLPFNIPGVFFAILCGTVLFFIFSSIGFAGPARTLPTLNLHLSLPLPSIAFFKELPTAIHYLPLALPFAFITIVGGINVTESARLAGDDYSTRNILLVEAFTTLIAGVCGGAAQTTPYIGHPAYKRIGCHAGYVVLTGLIVGLGGLFGYATYIVELIPRAVLAPILIFVALDIIAQSFQDTEREENLAVAFAFFPAIARLLTIKLTDPALALPLPGSAGLSAGHALTEMQAIIVLGNGFILTGMLWAAALSSLIRRRPVAAAAFVFTLAVMSFFGIVHSVFLDGQMYLPWTLGESARAVPYQISVGYAGLAGVLVLLSRVKAKRMGANEEVAPEAFNAEDSELVSGSKSFTGR